MTVAQAMEKLKEYNPEALFGPEIDDFKWADSSDINIYHEPRDAPKMEAKRVMLRLSRY
jgi:hypothetical protein